MGIANIQNTSTSSGGGGGEIIRELINSSDGAGVFFSNTGYIHLANNAAAEFGTSDFSIEFILNQTGEVGTSGGSIYQSATTVNNKFSIENHVSSNVVKLIFFNAVGAASQYDLSYNMAADYNEPTHYVVSCDRSGNAVLYRNGTEVASVSIAASASTNLGDGVTSTAMIGNSGSGYTFLGGLYRFRTFSKVLSHDEVNTCFQRADVQNALKTNLLTDYDLAFANPTQSAMCQDRAGNSDGTMGGTIQQTQPIVQLNSTSARIGTSAATPADGTLLTRKLQVGGAGEETHPQLQIVPGTNSGDSMIQFRNTANAGTVAQIKAKQTSGTIDGLVMGTAEAEHLSIDSSGRVIIGAGAMPLKWWNGSSYGCKFLVENNGSTAPADYVTGGVVRNTNDGEAPQLGFAKSRGTTTGAVTVVQSGDPLGTMTFQGADGTNYVEGARINALVDGTPGADDMPGKLQFATTADGAASPTVRMTIDSAGDITQAGGKLVFQDGSGANVGEISTLGGNNLTISSSQSNHCGVSFATQAILPATQSATNNNAVDLGANGNAFKDLHLGGAANIGGLATFTNGIAFSQTDTSATGASATSTTLNHFETGTWTPRIAGNTSGVKTAGTNNLGRYTRIGNLVTLTGTVVINGSETIAGEVKLTGLPFTSANISGYRGVGIIGASSGAVTATSGHSGLRFIVDANSPHAWIVQLATDNDGYNHTPAVSSGANVALLGINITYQV